MKNFDVGVIGLGVIGAAALQHLAACGVGAIGIDAYGPTHQYGSSSGGSRIFRRAYWEGAKYLPLLDRADKLWRELQDRCSETIVVPTGGLFVGRRFDGVVRQSQETARVGDVAHEMLTAADVRSTFPAFDIADDMEAIYEPGAYLIRSDTARLAMLDLAVEQGAAVRFGERITHLASDDAHITMTARDGERFTCDAVVVASGPWMATELLPELAPLLSPARVPVYWFGMGQDRRDRFEVGRFPVFLYETEDRRIIYGCPWGPADDGVKIGFHNWQQICAPPDNLDRNVGEEFKQEINGVVEKFLPDLAQSLIRSRVCYYTMSPDGDFLIGTAQGDPRIAYASACSGHGFKFAPAVGEAVARLALGWSPQTNLDHYSAARFNR